MLVGQDFASPTEQKFSAADAYPEAKSDRRSEVESDDLRSDSRAKKSLLRSPPMHLSHVVEKLITCRRDESKRFGWVEFVSTRYAPNKSCQSTDSSLKLVPQMPRPGSGCSLGIEQRAPIKRGYHRKTHAQEHEKFVRSNPHRSGRCSGSSCVIRFERVCTKSAVFISPENFVRSTI